MSKVYPCVHCTDDGFCKKHSDNQVTCWCVQGPCKDERPSHADKLRAMSDEELAAWLADHPMVSMYDGSNPQHKAWLDWLKQEASQ